MGGLCKQEAVSCDGGDVDNIVDSFLVGGVLSKNACHYVLYYGYHLLYLFDVLQFIFHQLPITKKRVMKLNIKTNMRM